MVGRGVGVVVRGVETGEVGEEVGAGGGGAEGEGVAVGAEGAGVAGVGEGWAGGGGFGGVQGEQAGGGSELLERLRAREKFGRGSAVRAGEAGGRERGEIEAAAEVFDGETVERDLGEAGEAPRR